MTHLGRFILVGGFATCLQFALMVALVRGFGVAPVAASACGFVLSALANYQLNRIYTFASRTPHATALARFGVVAGVGLVINAAVMYTLANLLQLHYMLAQALATGIVLMWNFVLSKRWSFASTG